MNVSIIIPVRNEGPAFALMLQYLVELQSRVDLEVILVDDASDPPVKAVPAGMRLIRHHVRYGIAKSRNAGARWATGDLLLHTDGHVFFSESALERLCDASDDRSVLGVQTQLIFDIEQFKRRQTLNLEGPNYFGWRWEFEPQARVCPIFTPLSLEPHDVPYVGAAGLAIPRTLFEALGGFDESLTGCGGFEDADLAMTAWACGYRVRMLPEVVCYHYTQLVPSPSRSGRSSLDVERYENSLENALRILRRHLLDDQFRRLAARTAEQFPASWSTLPAQFLTALMNSSVVPAPWEPARVRSREWVAHKARGDIQ